MLTSALAKPLPRNRFRFLAGKESTLSRTRPRTPGAGEGPGRGESGLDTFPHRDRFGTKTGQGRVQGRHPRRDYPGTR